MRARRSASFTIRSASGRVTAGSSSATSVSASTSSAPMGVLSSWLTLATKSRRTLSMRCTSDTSATNAATPSGRSGEPIGTADRWHAPRGAEDLLLAFTALAVECTRHQRVESCRDDRVGMTGLAVALGRRVAVHLAAVDVEDDHPLAELVERGQQLVALTDCGFGVVERSGERLFQLGVLLASLWAHDLSRTAP